MLDFIVRSLTVTFLIASSLLSPSVTITNDVNVPPRELLTENEIHLWERLEEKGISDEFPIFDIIIQHESGWNEKATTSLSSAKGLGQIIDSTWADCKGDVLNGKDNIDCVIGLYEDAGIVHWCTDFRGNAVLTEKGLPCTAEMIDPRSYKYAN